MAESLAATPYTPLPSNDPSATRLVKILPAGFHDPVQCELETISLTNEPSYIALSYVWGDPIDTVPILLDGVEHGVTKNLDSFLRHLQALLNEIVLVLQCVPVHNWPTGLQIIEALNSLPSSEQNSENLTEMARVAMVVYFESIYDQASINEICMETTRPVQITQRNDLSLPRFWIDALCINQNDLAERNKQVKRMNHIYRQTDLLFVWGLNHQQQEISELLSRSVFREIEALSWKLARLGHESSLITNESGVNNAARRLFASQMRSKEALVGVIGIFFELEWFYRAWIFQEVALSASKPSELWMGFKHISLSKLLLVSTAILEISTELENKDDLLRQVYEFKAGRILVALRMEKNLVDFGQDSLHSAKHASNISICRRLIYVLSAGHLGFKVTDPRDAIYSFYGLLSTSHLPDMLEPDYTKPVSAVYHSIAAFLLSQMGIDILGFLLSSLNGMDGCPSWVPDFVCLQRYDTLCQQYPAAVTTYKHR